MADTDAHPITVAIERRIDPTRTAEATSWMQAGTDLATAFPGFLGSGWVRAGEDSDLWYMLYRFRDITTLLGSAHAFRRAVDLLVQPWAGLKIDKVAGVEARGFILGGAVAHQVSAGFVPIRKKGKLPHTKVSIAYSLEYGVDEMEMHSDALTPGERVILVDDLIATGGTAEGAVKLLQSIGANVVAACFVINLPDLGGASKIEALGVPVRTLMSFDGH